MRYHIACIVVTYNRKELLINCLDAIRNQTFKPIAVYIIDNASTDGTKDLLESKNYIGNECTEIEFNYIRLNQNLGGAGGFYEGMKRAYEKRRYDAYWVMDDDGVPNENCLFYLQQSLEKYSYVAPLVLDVKDPSYLSFPSETEKTLLDIQNKYGENGTILNRSNPFNGILYRDDLVGAIGFPKKDMFIWGDECEYEERARAHGVFPVTIIKAIHLHPKDRMVFHKDLLGKPAIIFTDSELRNYCKYRNTAYLLKKYKPKSYLIIFWIRYVLFFCIQRRFDIKNLHLFISAVKEALESHEFVGHWKFISK